MMPRSETTAWTLESNRLKIRVAKPGFIYQRTRFDWTGLVTDVLLDNTHSFCSVESPNPLVGAGGIGLVSEFGIHEPIGYDTAAIGDTFPKLGVGLLERPDDADYFFMRPYPLTPFPTTVTPVENGLRFEQAPIACRGYAARLTKTLTLADNAVTVSFLLENVGEKPLETTEYNHNFLQLNGQPTGSGYRFTTAVPLRFHRNDNSLWSSDGTLTWEDGVQGFHAHGREIPDMAGFSWTLRQQLHGIAVTESVDFRPLRVACWGMAHVISPEVFHQIRLAPGESDAWTRRWIFESGV